MTPEARIAEAARTHWPADSYKARNRETGERAIVTECACGDQCTDWPAHLAAVIAALPDIAIVELPKPEVLEWSDGAKTDVWENNPVATVQTWPGAGEVLLRDDFENTHTVPDVTNFAAALLAAARAAGGGS